MSSFKDASDDFSIVSHELKLLLNNVNNTDNTINKLVNSSELHDNLNNILLDISSLVQDIESNPTKYIRAYIKAQ